MPTYSRSFKDELRTRRMKRISIILQRQQYYIIYFRKYEITVDFVFHYKKNCICNLLTEYQKSNKLTVSIKNVNDTANIGDMELMELMLTFN